MTTSEKITNFQFGSICFTYLSGFSTLFMYSAKILRQDVWMANLLAVVAGIIILRLMTYVQQQYPDKNMNEILEHLLGRWLGKAIALVYLVDTIGLTVLTLRALSVFYTTAILPNTSPDLIMLMLVLVTSYAVYLGLETIARTVQLLLPLFLVSIAVICLLIVRNIETNPFLPPFQSSLPNIVYGTLLAYSLPFGKANLLIFLFHKVDNRKNLALSSSVSLILSNVYLIIASYLTIGSLGMNLIQTSTFPFFSSIQLVRVGLYLERIEIIVIGIWTIFSLFETVIGHYLFTHAVGDLLRIKDTKPFILPFGLLFFAVALHSFVRPMELGAYNHAILPFSILFPALVMPIVLSLLTFSKRALARVRGQSG